MCACVRGHILICWLLLCSDNSRLRVTSLLPEVREIWSSPLNTFLFILVFFNIKIHSAHESQAPCKINNEKRNPRHAPECHQYAAVSLFQFHGSSIDLLHHLSQIYLPRYSAASLWPCRRTEKREGIITCHLADNGVPWSFHLFPFKDLKTKNNSWCCKRNIWSCLRAWAQIYALNMYHSYRNEVETGVLLFPCSFFVAARHTVAIQAPYIPMITENALTVAIS